MKSEAGGSHLQLGGEGGKVEPGGGQPYLQPERRGQIRLKILKSRGKTVAVNSSVRVSNPKLCRSLAVQLNPWQK